MPTTEEEETEGAILLQGLYGKTTEWLDWEGGSAY
jgi:hypothetical protein